MKNFIIFLFISLLLCSLYSIDLDVSTGISCGYSPWSRTVTDSFENTETTFKSIDLIIGYYFDFKFLRVGADFTVSNEAIEEETSAGETTTINYPLFYKRSLDTYILLKYGFKVGIISIWPAVGFEYSKMYAFNETDGVDNIEEIYPEFDDYYFLSGLGIDMKLFNRIKLGVMGNYCINLTANPFEEDLPTDLAVSVSKIKIMGFMGVAF